LKKHRQRLAEVERDLEQPSAGAPTRTRHETLRGPVSAQERQFVRGSSQQVRFTIAKTTTREPASTS
jgi:hypothetical protein